MASLSWSIVFTDTFQTAAREAVDYYLRGGGDAALQFVARLENVEKSLVAFPRMGALVEPGRPQRWVPVKAFIAVHEPDSENRRVVLVNLFYERMDWRGRLGSDQQS